MLITLLRHASAEDRQLLLADEERALTEKGIKQMKRVARFCQNHALIPEKLFSSPLTRAKQSAQVLQQQLDTHPDLVIVDWLAINSEIEIIIAELKKLATKSYNEVWLVGHEPTFSMLIENLIESLDNSIIIKKASLTRLDVDFSASTPARLLWSIPCKLM